MNKTVQLPLELFPPPAQEGPDLRGLLSKVGLGRIGSLFDCMETAERLIAAYQARHPDRADLLYDAFLTIRPTGSMTEKRAELYEAHARELLQRVVDGEDVRPATKAELVCILCDTSLIAGLHGDAAYLYTRLFREVFGQDALDLGDVVLQESYVGAADLLLDKLKAKARDDDRHRP
jgi:hypothetical protein